MSEKGLDWGSHLLRLEYEYEPAIRPLEDSVCGRRIKRLIERDRGNIHWTIAQSRQYINDFLKIDARSADPSQPSISNVWLHALDGIVLYSLIRSLRPAMYLEIGSGNSTKYVRRAINDGGLATRIISIDPHPREEISAICDETLRKPVEEVADLEPIVRRLRAGDVIFIDNSHRSFQNSDVTVCFLELMPVVPKGVYVGVHDIFLPFDYKKPFLPFFYNEQYLLAMYLMGGCKDYRIVFPTHYVLQSKYRQAAAQLMEHPKIWDGVRGGCAFWMRRETSFWWDWARMDLGAFLDRFKEDHPRVAPFIPEL